MKLMLNPILKFKAIVFAIVLLTGFVVETNATHLAGGEIQYSCTGIRKWKVSLTIYHYCDGIPICNSFACTKQITAQPSPQISAGGVNPNGCSGPPVSFTVSLVKVEDVGNDKITRCGLQSKNECTNLGQVTPGSYRPSVEKYVFEGILDMSSPAYANVCAYYDLYNSECCRNSTTNVNGQPNYVIQSTINIHNNSGSNCKNNSPAFTNDAIAAFCAGQESVFNMGANDPDGDSLSYEIIKSLQALNGPVNYVAPYSQYKPFPLNDTLPPHNQFPWSSRIVLDTLTGDISFNPKNTSLTPIPGDLCVQVTQWSYTVNTQTGVKTPIMVGRTMQNLQIYSLPCTGNNPPKFETSPSLPNGKPKLHHNICAGGQICFTVTAKDTDYKPLQNPPRIDSTFLSWDESIVRPGKISFLRDYDTTQAKPREDRYEFCWQTDSADGRTLPYYFTIKAMDNFCPNPGKVVQAFSIKITEIPSFFITKHKVFCNNRINVRMTKQNLQQTFQSAQLIIAKSPYDYTFSQGADTTNSANPNPTLGGYLLEDTVTFNTPGKYLIKYMVTTASCSKIQYDTITIDSIMNVVVADTSKCRYASVVLSGTVNGGVSPYTYYWYRNSSNTNPLNGPNFSLNKTYTATDTISNKYILSVRDQFGCERRDTLNLTVNDKDTLISISVLDTSKCKHSSVVLEGTVNGGTSPYNYMWYKNTINSAPVNGPNYLLKAYTAIDSINTKYILVVRDQTGCQRQDTLNLKVNHIELTDVIKTGADIQCLSDNQYKFSKGNLNNFKNYTYKWVYDNITKTDSSISIHYTSAGSKTLAFIVNEPQGCSDTIYKKVQVAEMPVTASVINVDDSLQCLKGNRFSFTRVALQGYTYTWLYDGSSSLLATLPVTYNSAGEKTVKLKIQTANGCIDTALTKVMVTSLPGPPAINISTSDTQCIQGNFFSFNHVFQPGVTYQWVYDNKSSTDSILSYSYPTPGNKTIRLRLSEYGGCKDSISKNIVVAAPPVTNNVILVNDSQQCAGDNSFSFTYSNANNPQQFKHTWLYQGSNAVTNPFIKSGISAGTHVIKLIIAQNKGCSDTAERLITVDAIPIANGSLSVNNATQCLNGNSFVFTHTSQGGSSNAAKWLIDSQFFNAPIVTHSFKTPGNKQARLILISPNGCKDSADIQVIVKPMPVYHVVQGNINVKADSTYTYTVQAQQGFSYKWTVSNNGSFITSDTLTSVGVKWLNAGSGSLDAKQTFDGCSMTYTLPVTIAPSVGLKEENNLHSVGLMPNPNNGVFTIQMKSLKKQSSRVILYNAIGAEVLNKVYEISTGTNNLEVSADLANGIYLLTISDGVSQIVRRVIIAK